MEYFARASDLLSAQFYTSLNPTSQLCISAENDFPSPEIQHFALAPQNNFNVPPLLPKNELFLTSDEQNSANSANFINNKLSSDFSNSVSMATTTGSNPTNNQKTPMSAVVDLARYNKLIHKYALVNESGPAHNKQFTVNLILREGEEYIGVGPSIKKAQQAAAKKAMDETTLPKPSSSIKKHHQSAPVVSPTVTLNALLLKLKLTAEYANLPSYRCPVYAPQVPINSPPYYDGYSAGLSCQCNPQYFSVVHCVFLKIGRLEFVGRGPTRQLARHSAAEQAVKVLQNIYLYTNNSKNKSNNDSFNNSKANPNLHIIRNKNGSQIAKISSNDNSNELRANEKQENDTKTVKNEDNFSENLTKDEENLAALKSPISVIYEIALRKKFAIDFSVISESGPAHERLFVIRLTLKSTNSHVMNSGNGEKSDDICSLSLTVDGEGRNKKRAKYDSCLKMIEKIQLNDELYAEYLSIMNNSVDHVTSKVVRVKRETIIKDVKMDPNYGQQINPVSRLVQIQQAKKQDEPKFSLFGESGQGRYKEYTIEVTVGDQSCKATGPNKKLAKRTAAELMLEKLGLNKPSPKPGKPVLKHKITKDESMDGENRPENFSASISDDGNASEFGNSDSFSCETNNNNCPAVDSGSNPISTPINSPDAPSCPLTVRRRRVTFDVNQSESSEKEKGGHVTPFGSSKKKFGHKDKEQQQSYGWQIAPGLLYAPALMKNNDEGTFNNGSIPGDSDKKKLEYLAASMKIDVNFSTRQKTASSNEGLPESLALVCLGLNPKQTFYGAGSSPEMASNAAAEAALKFLLENS